MVHNEDPLPKDTVAPKSPAGVAPLPYTFRASQLKPTPLAGGSVKIIDSSNFKIAQTIAAAEVTVVPGAIRELHVSRCVFAQLKVLVNVHLFSGTPPRMNGATSCKSLLIATRARLTQSCCSEGTGRITLFASSGNAQTFDFQPGDIGYVPASYGELSLTRRRP